MKWPSAILKYLGGIQFKNENCQLCVQYVYAVYTVCVGVFTANSSVKVSVCTVQTIQSAS